MLHIIVGVLSRHWDDRVIVV